MIPTDKLPPPPKFVQSVPDLGEVEHLLTALVIISCIYLIVFIVDKLLLAPKDDEFRICMNELVYFDERGQLESLLKKANEILAMHDSQSLATYYKGRALYRLDRHEEAYTVFTKLGDLDPSWSVNYADPYLKKLREKLGLAKL